MIRHAAPFPVGFVIGGAMKAGTTALSSFLSAHPEVCMASGKEAHFFDVDENFPPGREPDWAYYHSKFAPRAGERLLGDATPIYLYWERAAARIQAYNPAMRWVILLRQPAERAHSHWNAFRAAGLETLDFEDALAAEPARRAALSHQDRIGSYIDRGYYARQLRRLFAVVPREQVLVLRTEELRDGHDATMRRVAGHLGIADIRTAAARVHATPHEVPLGAGARRRLTALYEEDIRDLERLLGWDLSDWLRG